MNLPTDGIELRNRNLLAEALAGVGSGSQSALQFVYSRTSAKLFGLCLRILKDRSDAEDILQDVYVNVWRKAASFDPAKASPITWLATLARNRAIDRLRARGKSAVAGDVDQAAAQVPDDSPDALSLLEAAEDRKRLMGCVEELEERQSSAIRAAFLDGLSYSELADRSTVPLGTMKSWIRRGLLRLKDCLER